MVLRGALLTCWVFLAAVLAASPAIAQDADLLDRPVSRVTLLGLDRVDERTVLNNIRVSVGDPYDRAVIKSDVQRLTRLGEFREITPSGILLPDGTVEVVYRFVEQPIIAEIQVVGNRLISDRDLLAVVRQFPGLARDDYLIKKAKADMEQLYRKRGHYLTTVTVDDSELEQSGILLFRIIEGPRVKVKAVTFEGNDAFEDRRLGPEVKTKPALPFIRGGALDESVLEQDLVALDAFYKDRGYLDVRVGRRIELSPDNREAKVVFLVDEGPQYVLRDVQARNARTGEPLTVFADEQIAAMIEIKRGDAFGRNLISKSERVIADAYGRLGYLDVRVRSRESRSGAVAQADLIFDIDEGARANVGLVRIKGNFLTRDKVIRRLVRLEPGRPYDGTELLRSQQRLEQTRLFNDVRLTVQDPAPGEPLTRDLLVEIKERNTGAFNFGFAVGSDSGLFGSFSLTQDNFDIADVPASLDEFIKGAAFRGAGQKFSLSLLPGTEVTQFNVSLTEPHLLETDYSGTVSAQFFQRDFDIYDEKRLRSSLGLGRRVGDFWTVNLSSRFEQVELSEIDPDSPVEIFRDAGPDTLVGLGLNVTRSTLPTIVRPYRGSLLRVGAERVGFFTDVEFNRVDLDYQVYLTLAEDFFERRTTLRLSTRVGYIFGGTAPTYESFYLGGRSLRGFDFRTVSPKGLDLNGNQTDEPVGGDWLFSAGAQVEFPLIGEQITGVVFVDTGTVTESIAFDPYRVSVGAGIRLTIPQLGPVPIAFDFGFPVLSDDLDEEQIFSFSIDVPFR